MSSSRWLRCAVVSSIALAGCSKDEGPPVPSAQTVRGELAGVTLQLEVADDPAERAVGLMDRASVPPGTGMVFRYDEPVTAEFYMYRVRVPLLAVFVLEGRVVSFVRMEPCPVPDPGDCPLYRATGPYDTVVETAPETLPRVRRGDLLQIS